jgi:N4-(beta-N-acetylglucosaminyl)-L-asparaginase
VARKVMEETPHVMLSGQGALDFALEQGYEKENLLTEESKRTWEQWSKEKKPFGETNFENHDTIGILAIDQAGNISGACTTSGMAYKRHGRVGDSPIIGAGMYVDNEVGGACATGVGEYVMKTLGSFLIVELMRQGSTPQEACEEAIRRIVTKHPRRFRDFQVGYLALNKQGELGAFGTEKGFEYTLFSQGAQGKHPADHYLKN